MKLYASVTGTKRNLAAMKAAAFGLVVTSGTGHKPVPGFTHGIDNGKFKCWTAGTRWDEAEFVRIAAIYGTAADWIVVPDVITDREQTLALLPVWLPLLQPLCRLRLIAVQDGMTPSDIDHLVGPTVGIFLGGSTEWKLATMEMWGRYCASRGIYYHVGRVNTARRLRLAHAAGASSVDGTSASRFAKTVPLLARAAAQPDLMDPRRV